MNMEAVLMSRDGSAGLMLDISKPIQEMVRINDIRRLYLYLLKHNAIVVRVEKKDCRYIVHLLCTDFVTTKTPVGTNTSLNPTITLGPAIRW